MLIYALIVVFCCFLYGASAVLCKIGLQRNARLCSESSRWITVLSLIKNKIWLAGVFLSIFANVAIIEIQSIIDISVVYPILNFSFIFALILGYVVLKELLTKNQWLGVTLVIIGTIIMLFVTDPITGHQTDVYYLKFITFSSIASIIALIMLAINNRDINYEVFYAIASGIALGNVETYLKATTNLIIAEIGHFSVFSSQSIAEFMTVWPFLVLILFSAVGFICMQLAYSHGNVSVTVPVIAFTQRPVTICSAYYIFGEQFTLTKIIGIIVILFGVLALILASVKQGKSDPILSKQY